MNRVSALFAVTIARHGPPMNARYYNSNNFLRVGDTLLAFDALWITQKGPIILRMHRFWNAWSNLAHVFACSTCHVTFSYPERHQNDVSFSQIGGRKHA